MQYSQDREILQLSIGRLMKEILEATLRSDKSAFPRLLLYSGHDATILPLSGMSHSQVTSLFKQQQLQICNSLLDCLVHLKPFNLCSISWFSLIILFLLVFLVLFKALSIILAIYLQSKSQWLLKCLLWRHQTSLQVHLLSRKDQVSQKIMLIGRASLIVMWTVCSWRQLHWELNGKLGHLTQHPFASSGGVALKVSSLWGFSTTVTKSPFLYLIKSTKAHRRKHFWRWKSSRHSQIGLFCPRTHSRNCAKTCLSFETQLRDCCIV